MALDKMAQEEQQNAFEDEIDRVIDRFVGEFDLTIASAIGVLELVKLRLFAREALEMDEEDIE